MNSLVLILILGQPGFEFIGKHLPYPPTPDYPGKYPIEKVKFDYTFQPPSGDSIKYPNNYIVFDPQELSATEKELFRKALRAWLNKMKELGQELPPWADGRTGYETIEAIESLSGDNHIYKGWIEIKDTTIPTPEVAALTNTRGTSYPNEKIIERFHIVFNRKYSDLWHFDTLPPPSGKISFYTLAQHEIGHVLELRHYNSPTSIMNEGINLRREFYFPFPDSGSIAGAAYIYPRFYTGSSEARTLWGRIFPFEGYTWGNYIADSLYFYHVKNVPFYYPGKGFILISSDSLPRDVPPNETFNTPYYVSHELVFSLDLLPFSQRILFYWPMSNELIYCDNPPPTDSIDYNFPFSWYLEDFGLQDVPQIFPNFTVGFRNMFWYYGVPCDFPTSIKQWRGYSKIYFAHIPEEYTGFSNNGQIWNMQSLVPPSSPLTFKEEDIPSNNAQRLFQDSSGYFHQLVSRNDSIFDLIYLNGNLTDTIFLGIGKNPAGAMDENRNIYAVWSYNDTDGVEELRFAKYIYETGNWDTPFKLYDNFETFFWGIGAPTFTIFSDTGFVSWETTRGPCYHISEPPYPCLAVIIEDKVLLAGKFSVSNPVSFEYDSVDYIRIAGPEPIEIPRDSFYYFIVPTLISPSIYADADTALHILWDGIQDTLRYYYKSKIDTVFERVFIDSWNPYYPNISGISLETRMLWVDNKDSLSVLKEMHTYSGVDTLSFPDALFNSTLSQVLHPVSLGRYYLFIDTWEQGSRLWFGVIDSTQEVLFSAPKILSPQISYEPDSNRIHITFYAGDTLGNYQIYYILKNIPGLTLLYESFGKTEPSPLTIFREGFKETQVLKEDFGDSLVYKIPMFIDIPLRINLKAYNPENDKIKAKVFINSHPLGIWKIKEKEAGIFEKKIPHPFVSRISRLSLRKKKGEKIYLSNLTLSLAKEKGKGSSGPQEIAVSPIYRFDIKIQTLLKDKNFLKLIIPRKGRLQVSIFDVTGRKKYGFQRIYEKGTYKISIPQFPSGVYFIEGKFEERRKVRKILRIY